MKTDVIPKTMKAVQGKDYGSPDVMLSVQEDGVRVPRLSDLPPKQQKNFLLIQTHAVALAPGDCRVLSGLTRELQGPPSFPYIPGGDCSGVVVQVPEDEDCPYQVGDRVAARFFYAPRGALGEYALVHQGVCGKIPANVSFEEAAALASATPALLMADRIQKGDRVLVLGAGGGIGSHFVQMIRQRGAAQVVGVSQSPQRLLEPPLLCDKAIDYTKEDPFALKEFKENPFDVVFDLASGGWPRILQDYNKNLPLIVKPASLGGRYITSTPDSPIFELHSVWAALKVFLFPALWRFFKTRLWARRKLPKYTFALDLPDKSDVAARALDLAGKGTLKAVIDPRGPFSFTTEGIRAAFRLQESHHTKGKVVVQVAHSS